MAACSYRFNILGDFAYPGTSNQDIDVFKLRNQFGLLKREFRPKLYEGRGKVQTTYRCQERDAQLDDFSTSEYDLRFKVGEDSRSLAAVKEGSFSKHYVRGVYHPNEWVGFSARKTPGAIQEVEIVRMKNDIYIERVYVAAVHTLRGKEKERWSDLQAKHELAVSFHDQWPGNERYEGLVTAYVRCPGETALENYDPAWTGGIEYELGSVEFVRAPKRPKGNVLKGILSKEQPINNVWYSGEITFFENGNVRTGTITRPSPIGGANMTGEIEYFENGNPKRIVLSAETTISGVTLSGVLEFWEESGKPSSAWVPDGARYMGQELRYKIGFHRNGVIAYGTLSDTGSFNGISYMGMISFFDDGQVHAGVLREDQTVFGLPLYRNIEFKPSGRLLFGYLAEPREVGGFSLDSGMIRYFENSEEIKFGVFAEETIFDDVPYRGKVRFSQPGQVACGTLAKEYQHGDSFLAAEKPIVWAKAEDSESGRKVVTGYLSRPKLVLLSASWCKIEGYFDIADGKKIVQLGDQCRLPGGGSRWYWWDKGEIVQEFYSHGETSFGFPREDIVRSCSTTDS